MGLQENRKIKRKGFALASGLITAALGCPAIAQDAKADERNVETDKDVIVVTAQRRNQTEVRSGGDLGVFGDKDAIDTPFTFRTFDETLIQNQQPQSLGDVLENDPTVRRTLGSGNASEQFVIRGFQVFGDDVGMNGLFGVTPRQLVAPELYSGVQVLNGANAFLNGASPGGSGIGGGVNLQMKHALAEPLTRATLNYSSKEHFGGSADVSRRFGNEDQVGARVNGAFRSGNGAIDDEFRETLVLGGAFDWEVGNMRFIVDGAFQRVEVNQFRPKIRVTGAVPEVPDNNVNYGPSYATTELESVFGQVRFEYDLTDNAMFYASAGALRSEEFGQYGRFTLTDIGTGDGTNSGSIIAARQRNEAMETGLRVKFGSAITHEVNVGANANWQQFRSAFDFRQSVYQNLYDPVEMPLSPVQTFVRGDLDDPSISNLSRQLSAFVSDTIGFWDDRILLTGGLRLQEVKSGLGSFYKEDAVTPVVGLVVRPADNISFFANRIEGLTQGGTAPDSGSDPDDPGGAELPVSNGGEVLRPSKSVQYELGGKIEMERFSASLALFQIEMPSFYLGADPDAPGFLLFSDFGNQRNRGVELFLSGEPVEGLRLITGGAIIDTELRETAGGVNEGNAALGVPKYTMNANAEWDLSFAPGVTLTGRIVHTGEQYADTSNLLELDSWTRADLGARYVFVGANRPVTLRFTVDNVANSRYWSSGYTAFGSGTGRLLQGRPRTFKASASIDF
ncbi:TonB-dependent receptor [Hyphococcus lacteus]|uniref:TonB-dependent siderophore receptor n=1 Tax=Hyphococcus lacteus TaxID=3143536 RepID=A0ABV3Z9R5_9PROT